MSMPVPANAPPYAQTVIGAGSPGASWRALRGCGSWPSCGPRAARTRDFCRACDTSTVVNDRRSTSFMARVMCLIRPPANTHHVGVGVRGDERRDVIERIQCAGESEQHDAGVGDQSRLQAHRSEAPVETGGLRVGREGALRGERILVHADAGCPGIRRPERERAVLVADDHDRPGGRRRACRGGLVQDQPVGCVGGEQVGTFDVGPAPERVGGVGRHPDSLAWDERERRACAHDRERRGRLRAPAFFALLCARTRAPPDRSRESASTVAARISTPPVTIRLKPAGRLSRPRPFVITAITRAPIAAFMSRPRPPKRLTPPTTAAATPLSTMSRPTVASTEPTRETLNSMAATARDEQITNAHHLIQRTFTPERRAASALPPIA